MTGCKQSLFSGQIPPNGLEEEEELPAQLPSDPGVREGKRGDSEEENILASLKTLFSDADADPRGRRRR